MAFTAKGRAHEYALAARPAPDRGQAFDSLVSGRIRDPAHREASVGGDLRRLLRRSPGRMVHSDRTPPRHVRALSSPARRAARRRSGRVSSAACHADRWPPGRSRDVCEDARRSETRSPPRPRRSGRRQWGIAAAGSSRPEASPFLTTTPTPAASRLDDLELRVVEGVILDHQAIDDSGLDGARRWPSTVLPLKPMKRRSPRSRRRARVSRTAVVDDREVVAVGVNEDQIQPVGPSRRRLRVMLWSIATAEKSNRPTPSSNVSPTLVDRMNSSRRSGERPSRRPRSSRRPVRCRSDRCPSSRPPPAALRRRRRREGRRRAHTCRLVPSDLERAEPHRGRVQAGAAERTS